MDFNDTPAEAEYRAQVRTWLDANIGEFRDVPDTADRSDFVARSSAGRRSSTPRATPASPGPRHSAARGSAR